MDAFSLDEQTLNLLQRTAALFASAEVTGVYLVGGALRNLWLGLPAVDWDLVVVEQAPLWARRLADALGGHSVHMHEKASRVVMRSAQGEITIDVSPLMGTSIEEDLRARDFTINALALPLRAGVEQLSRLAAALSPSSLAQLPWSDPLGGRADLQARRLRAVGETVFRQDPLRLLRAVRLAGRYGLTITPTTARLMRRDAALLSQVAVERVHAELCALLQDDGAMQRLQLLDTYDLLTTLMPELSAARGLPQPFPHYWDVFTHSLATVEALEIFTHALRAPAGDRGNGMAAARFPLLEATEREGGLPELRALLREAEHQGVFQVEALRTPALKLAALLHDIGKPLTFSRDEEGEVHFYGHQQVGAGVAEAMMKRLGASNQERRLVRLITAHHMRPGQLARQESLTPRAIRRYFVDLGAHGLHVALFSLADHLATYGPASAQRPPGSWERHVAGVILLLRSYLYERERYLPRQLLSGSELMRRLGLAPGPLIGELLEVLAEARAEERIHSKEEALWLAQDYLRKRAGEA
jgi:poly(A) polymerase